MFFWTSFISIISYSENLAKNELSRVKLFKILNSLNIAYLEDPDLYASMLNELYLIVKCLFFSPK